MAMMEEDNTVCSGNSLNSIAEIITVSDDDEVDVTVCGDCLGVVPQGPEGSGSEGNSDAGSVPRGSGDGSSILLDPPRLLDSLVEMSARSGLLSNTDVFECCICFTDVPQGKGVVLQECLHSFCVDCLTDMVKHCDEVEVRCPYSSLECACHGKLLDGEIRALASDEVLARRATLSLRHAGLDLATGEMWPSLAETVKRHLVLNSVRFDCPICFTAVPPNAGVVLKQCLHAYCRSCLTSVLDNSDTEPVPCPCTSSDYACEGWLLQEEVRELLGAAGFARYLDRALAQSTKRRSDRQMWPKLQAAGQQDLAPNADAFDCSICFCEVPPDAGVVLKECLHSFCRECLADLVKHCEAPEVKCPFVSAEYSCQSTLTEKEIRALVSTDVYERHLARSLNQAEGNTANSFHCRTPSCAGWCELEDTVNAFCCPVCSCVNCITCRAIHEGSDCRQYQARLAEDALHNEEARKTQEYLKQMVARREAIHCPVCAVILMKKDGCDWVVCSACRNEVCWVTGKARWGRRGRGDISGGCRCRVGGKLCHPNCNNCH